MFNDYRINLSQGQDPVSGQDTITVSHHVVSVTVDYDHHAESRAMEALAQITQDHKYTTMDERMDAKILSGLIKNAMEKS